MSERKLKIGITCYPTYGGSGVIATEIGTQMAKLGHKVHFISADLPRRFDRFTENVFFHSVEPHDYPLFAFPHYDLALASKMVEVCTYENLDILHVHYAVPHATSAYLARQIIGKNAPKIITTLHGTDITLVGNERSYLPVARFSILESDAVTAPSMFLRHATYDKLNIPTSFHIEIIPNFVDTNKFIPKDNSHLPCELRQCLQIKDKPILLHISNFRPVKRVEDVIRIFAEVKKEIDCHLVMVGDGPDRSLAESLAHELNLHSSICFLGKQESVETIVRAADLFLLPSKNESFGLAALEALSCGVPVIASNAEGIPEVIKDDEVGYISDIGNVGEMAKNCIMLLKNKDQLQRLSKNARKLAEDNFNTTKIINQYEQFYYKVLNKS